MALTFAAVEEEQYDEAVAHGAKLAQISPDFGSHVMCYAVALALAGRMVEARQVCGRALEIEPALSISQQQSIGGSANIVERWGRALRLLGVPE
jgi:adenylate cyclase